MRWLAILPLTIALAACENESLSPEEQAERDAANIAAVEATNAQIVATPIHPKEITYPDIERYQIFGASCAFAPDDSNGTIVLAMDDTAWIKLDDNGLTRLAADKGSSELPMGTFSQYDGTEFSIELALESDQGTISGEETMNYPGFVIIRNAADLVAYQAEGTVQCGA